MKNPPPGWPRISSAVFYDDPARAIDWLVDAFGFVIRIKVEGDGGRIEHSELEFGEGLIMVGGAGPSGREDRPVHASPKSVGGMNTQSLCIHVDDADAHCTYARAKGAKILIEPKTEDYGEEYFANRSYLAEDPEGHQWWFMQRVRG
jgi:uncharacterized glyoxalase superfamily protein PhnB